MENITTTNNTIAIANAVQASTQKQLGKLSLFEVRSLMGQIMVPSAVLADSVTVSDTVNDRVRDEISGKDAAYSAKTLGKIFAKEQLDELHQIRDGAVAYLEKVGTRIPGQSAWYVLADRHDEISVTLSNFQQKFNDKVEEIVANYDEIVAGVVSEIDSKVSSQKIADAIKEKIPSASAVKARCTFAVSTAKLFDPAMLAESSAAIAADVANSITAIQAAEAGFWAKLSNPFKDMLSKIGSKSAGILGRKVTAMTTAVNRALAQELNLKLVFNEGEDRQLLNQILALLREVETKFCIKQQIPAPLEDSVLDNYYRVATIFSSLKSIKDFIESGAPLFEDGWDLRDLNRTLQIVNGSSVQSAPAGAETAPADATTVAEALDEITGLAQAAAEPAAPVAAATEDEPEEASAEDLAQLFGEDFSTTPKVVANDPKAADEPAVPVAAAAAAPAPETADPSADAILQLDGAGTAAEAEAPTDTQKTQVVDMPLSLDDFFNAKTDISHMMSF